MNIIHEPSIYLIGKQQLCDNEVTRFLDEHKTQWVHYENEVVAASEEISEFGGRVCYMSFDKPRPGGNAAYIDNIKSSGHGSVLEHAVWNLCITGVSRSLTHELVRHRAGVAYSQLSQRYVDESIAEYVEPDIIASDTELHRLWLAAITTAHLAYVELSNKLNQKIEDRENAKYVLEGVSSTMTKTEKRKEARQAARSVLPNATETKILFTANARAIRHFLELRGSRHAEPEIRKLANAILSVVVSDAPHIFGDYVREKLPDGTSEITTNYRKV